MPEPEDAPPQQPADFVAWMSTEMPDVAASGRRIQRRHLRMVASRPTRWRSVRRFRSTTRARRRDWARWLVAGVVLVLAGWGVVAIVHPFGLGRPAAPAPPVAAPVTSAPVPSAAVEPFPARVTWSGHTANRVATAADAGCQPGPGVPDAFSAAVLDAGGCLAILIAEYVDSAAHARMVIAMIMATDPQTTLMLPLRVSERLAGPALLTEPPAQTIFAGAAVCSQTVGLVGSAAATPGAKPDYQALATETDDLMRQMTRPGCGDLGHTPQ